MVKLSRATLAEQAYEELRSRIVSGRLPAGRRLRADHIADELAISQTPVKEALALLVRDGLVEGDARRASTVRRFAPGDIVEIYEARSLLELHALRVGRDSGRISAVFVGALRDLHEAQMRHAERR